jgi:hypothetical protein
MTAIPQHGWRRWVEEVACVPWSIAKHYISLFRAIDERRLTFSRRYGPSCVHEATTK